MKLTPKLLGYLNRVFDKDPHRFLALRLRYAGDSMTWSIADGVLTTAVTGGSGAPLNIDLSQYNLRDLVQHLAAQAGYTVEYADSTSLADLSALVLIDRDGDQDTSNGDHLYGYTTLLWAYLEAQAVELKAAREQIVQMLLQMEIPTAASIWLDEHGSYYGIRRKQGEADPTYSPRMIAEVLLVRGNNVALEIAIERATGIAVTVVDITEYDVDLQPKYDGAILHDGTNTYNAIGNPIYGLFDVEIDNATQQEVAEKSAEIIALVEVLRDAGTFLRQIVHGPIYDGTHTYDGAINYNGNVIT